jgi:oligoendopeptidase F
MSEGRPRAEVPPEDRWNLEPLYPSVEAWEADFAEARALPERVAAYAGRLSEADTVLAEALEAWFGATRRVEKLYVYAHLSSDQDLDDSASQGLYDRARSLFTALLSAGAYLAPEILAIDDETMGRWLEGEALAPYVFWLRDQLRAKPHTLSSAEERLMAMVSEPLAALQRAYSVLKNVEVSARLPQVADDAGQPRRLSHASFIELQESPDRDVRRAAFQAYYQEWAGNRATAAATLDGAIKAHVFEARARNHPSALAAALFEDNVDTAVYDALIGAVHDALPAFYRYVALRKRLLGVDALHMYDNYVSVLPKVGLRYTYDEAVETVLRGLAPLGPEYVDTAREGLTGGWVDRYENAGKRSGAYSSGCYDSWPYMLMNYTGTLDSVFTLAHELGHSMHSLYSNRAQPYHLADYRILVAEVASTTNEALLNHHLLETTTDRTTRAYLVDRYLDNFRATLFRQTMFAEFEKRVHEQVEAGQPLTKDWLDATYYDLVRLYFGDAVAFDEEDAPIAYEWARVDHFYYFYYVYKYATGMASAIAIAAAIQRGEPGALERYLAFLQSGGSDYPLELLKRAGVDLTTPQPVASALGEFDRLVGELEGLLS